MDYINIGSIENDGTGDDLRDAFIKVNRNFELLLDTSSGTLTPEKIKGSGTVKVTTNGNDVVISNDFSGSNLTDINSITVNGPITSTTNFIGNLVGLNGPATVDGVNISKINSQLTDFDFGTLSPIPTITSFIEYIKYLYSGVDSQTPTYDDPLAIIDMGSLVVEQEYDQVLDIINIVAEPARFNLEFGSF